MLPFFCSYVAVCVVRTLQENPVPNYNVLGPFLLVLDYLFHGHSFWSRITYFTVIFDNKSGSGQGRESMTGIHLLHVQRTNQAEQIQEGLK